MPAPENYKPFPDLKPWGKRSARYVVSDLGRVYRIDKGGRKVLVPMVPHARSFKVRLNGGMFTKMVPKAVWLAFGGTQEPMRRPDDPTVHAHWSLRIDPNAPIDSVTGVQSCAVIHLQWVYSRTLSQIHAGLAAEPPPYHHVLSAYRAPGDDS